MADESFRIDSTQVHPNVAWTYGTMWMLPSGPGAADVDMFLDSRPMESGLVFRGRVTRDRPFPLLCCRSSRLWWTHTSPR